MNRTKNVASPEPDPRGRFDRPEAAALNLDGAMESAPRVSVVIPHLNEPAELKQCLAALQEQEVDGIPFEIIVVDNGSRELPVISRADVRLERELVPGPGPARSRGASIARAEIIAFVDVDCVPQPGWIRGIVDFFDKHLDIDCVAGDVRVSWADRSRPTAIEAYEAIFGYRVKMYVERDHYAATGNMAVRRKAFRAVGPFGGIAIMEDRDWGQRATAQGFRIAFVPRVLVLTPPCKTFGELAKRWDRHIAHEFKDLRDHPISGAKWMSRAVAVAISPLAEIATVARTPRVSGLRARWLAWRCLGRLRLFRARRMLALYFNGNSAPMVESWNRD